ncbi:MAG: sugar transferase, partial [Chloroflexota bacterium]
FRPGITSRAMLFYAWGAIILLLSGFRVVVRWVIAQRRRRGIGLARVLVVGAGHVGKMVMQQIARRPGLGYQLVGFCDDVAWAQGTPFGRFQCLSNVVGLGDVIDAHRVDEVVIALPSAEHEKILEIVSLCRQRGVEFRLVPDTFDLTLGTLEVDDLAGIPLIGLRETALHGFNLALKRGTDVVLSGAALVAAIPILALAALAVRLESPGAAFYPQYRVGKNGPFKIYKVRSMYQDADVRLAEIKHGNEAGEVIFKMKNDPRRTRVGRVIRKLSLDELPQVWNVFKGDMSIVGPRPPLPHEVEQYDEWHKRRLEVTPGLTGLWQVSGRSDLPFDEMVMLDLYYIENWSLGLDLKIILQTIPAVLFMRGAY